MADLLPDQLRLMAAAYPDEVAYRNMGDRSSITFARWEEDSNRLARGLLARGVVKGDRVAVYLEPVRILDWIVAYAALHKLGAVCVPVNNRLSPSEVQVILHHAGARGLITSGSYAAGLAPFVGSLPDLAIVVTVDPADAIGSVSLVDLMDADSGPIQVPVEEHDLADVLYTSGTTGRPKGVAVRHNQVAHLPNGLPKWRGSGWLTAAPVFTFAGIGFIYNPMKAGMTVLFIPTFDARSWLDTVERERPVIAFIVPAMAQLLIHHPSFDSADLSSLGRLILGSAPLAPGTLLRLQAKLPDAAVLNSYGMTEGGHATFTMDPEGALTRPGAVGRPTPPVEVRIVDDDGVPCPTGEIGEVLTRNPSGHREYFRDSEATARLWEGGWLHTGDLGHLDAEGYLYIVGRKKDVIIRGGMNIYTDDVEAVLQAHPLVVEAAVVGVPHDVLGEDIAAFVVVRPDGNLPLDELREFARTRLADYKVPRQMTVVSELPRTASGKVVRSRLVVASGDGGVQVPDG
ncbi:MAG TPA: AMP-binding protein [Acidimicrobiales bacterium]